jgi:hypothetical protein
MSAKDDTIIHLRAVLRLAIKLMREANQHRYADFLELLIAADPSTARRFLD